MNIYKNGFSLILTMTLAIVGLLSPTFAQDAGSAPPAVKAQTVDVVGFRSARFGMTEKEIREAIVKDFKVKDADIRVANNEAERTTVLSVTVPDIIAEGGAADVSYVLGYKSKKLIQVGCLWSTATDSKITPAMLRADAQVLGAYFGTAGYMPESIGISLPIQSGVLVFRGTDKQGRMTILVLHGSSPVAGATSADFTPTALTLYYTEDPENPDIFRLAPGKF